MPLDGEGPDEPQHLAVIRQIAKEKQLPVFHHSDITFSPGLLSGAYYPMTYNSAFNYLFYLPVSGLNQDKGVSAILYYRLISSLLLALFSATLFLGLTKIKPTNLRISLTVTLFISLIPQVLFSGGYVNIEPVALLFSALVFYFLQNYLERKTFKSALLLGVFAGLLALCKVNYFIWLATALLIALVAIYKNHHGRERLYSVLALLLPIITINAYWWLRNYQLYGDPLIVNYISDQIRINAPDWFAPPAVRGYNIFSILFEANFIKFTYLGFFASLGGAIIFLPIIVYYIFYLLLFSPVVLALYNSFQLRSNRLQVAFLFLLIWLSLLYFANKNLTDFSPQGRHLFPLLFVFAWLMYLGLCRLKNRFLISISPLFSLVAAIYSLWFMVDRFYVKGSGYVSSSNFGNYLGDFSWRNLSPIKLEGLLNYIVNNNPKIFSFFPIIIYLLIFFILYFVIYIYIIWSKNDKNN